MTDYVYILKDPGTDTVRYVGRTRVPERRERLHQAGRGYPGNEALTAWEKAAKNAGKPVEFEVIASITTTKPLYGNIAGRFAEEFWIEYFRRVGAKLFNRT